MPDVATVLAAVRGTEAWSAGSITAGVVLVVVVGVAATRWMIRVVARR